MKHHDQPFYRRILADAWHIAWHHKHLWLLGFFASMVGFGIVTKPATGIADRLYRQLPDLFGGGAADLPGLATIRAITFSSSYPLLSFLMSMAAFAFLAAVFAWLAFVSVGALVGSVRKIERGGDPVFSEEIRVGVKGFWPVLGINLFAGLFLSALALLTAIPLGQLLEEGGWWRAIFYVGGYVVFTLLAVTASIVAVYATCEAAIKGRSVRTAIESGISTVSNHWLASLELAVALLVAYFLIGLASVAVAVILSVPFIFVIMLANLAGSPLGSSMTVTAALAAGTALIVTVGSLMTVFQVAAWTLFWGEIEAKRHPAPKIIRLARKHFPRLA